ncbi:uncharacterized protein LOC122063610 [Macadamia integrifolia]|uniref:uncharacterized protein LOC122063610 n=1 Tax=Macadamia integrifolia TaxID=60698 RepID=UPI001C4FF04B|nr:uncharacterized protein LOC122063610 [Macadamia integrifolia]
MSDELHSREAEAKTKPLKAVEMHKKLWAEKARCNWAKLGDPNHCIDHMELLQVIPNEVNREDSSILEAIPAREEIKKVCWEIVGDDFCGAVTAFFRCGKLLNGVNNSFVTLIPKVEGAVSLDKFCPICMENFFCKVLSKIMAERLSCLLPRLVSDEQEAFQKGKIISSNIGLASELADLLHTSVRGGGIGIKIDVQKAYDTLSWDFLFAVLKRFGFSDVWGLNGLLKEGKLKALPGPGGATVPSHLLFADDIFIFMNTGAKHVQCLREFLLKYQEFSGQKFSLEKSKVFFGKVAPHRKRYISDLLGIPTCSLPTRYLGIEIFKGAVKKDRMLPLMDKIKPRLQGWQGKLLSMAGRAELIWSVISGMPIHNFSIYWWPESVIKTVERWIRNFLWSGDIYTVKKITVK